MSVGTRTVPHVFRTKLDMELEKAAWRFIGLMVADFQMKLQVESQHQGKEVVDVASFKTGHLCKFFILLTHGYLIKPIIIQDIPMDLLMEH